MGAKGHTKRKRALAVARARAPRKRAQAWWEASDRALLDVRLCDLDLTIEGTALEGRVRQLWDELGDRGFRFRPYVWLSSDWFTPDRATGFAIPFFLAHPRLARLERHQMLEVEGGTHDWCMRILRHEAAHALDNAYRLHWKRRWRETFGRFSDPYRSSYTPDPHSREHVLNLDFWYSQSHPAEDWAETFAVWLDPKSNWRRRYKGWPALKKLEFVDELMDEIAAEPRVHDGRRREEPMRSLRMTLGEYYEAKRAHYVDEGSPKLDGQLRALFSPRGTRGSAAAFLRRNQKRLVQHVASTTGQHRYLIDHVIKEMILRSRIARLQLHASERDTLLNTAILLTSLTTQFLYGGHPHYHR